MTLLKFSGNSRRVRASLAPLAPFVLIACTVASALSSRAIATPLNRLLLANCRIVSLAQGDEDPFTGYIVVAADGRISAIGHGNAPGDIEATAVFDAAGQVAMPGFVSARGRLTPERAPSSAPGDLYFGMLHGALDLLRGGVTAECLDRAAVEREEIDAVVAAGAHVITTTDTNLPAAEPFISGSAIAGATIWNPLADGRRKVALVDAPALLKRNAVVGMSLDGGTGVDVADPFEAMRVGLYALRFRDADPRGLQPLDMLRLHTIGSARAVGVSDQLGTLEVGKLGDIILIDPHSPDTGPVIDLYATLVLACDRMNITSVFVGGTPVFDHGRHVTVNADVVAREFAKRTAAKNGPPLL